ncbi:MAG: hypothetical protein AAGC68_00365 [Verrucomicrobiota bacterium]
MKSKHLWRTILILGALIVFFYGQGVALHKRTTANWPFNPIGPYSSPPENFLADSENLVLVTSSGERDLITLEGIRYGVLRRWYRNIMRPPSEESRDEFLARLFDYVSEIYEGDDLLGIRLYELSWDLKKGTITSSTLAAEYSSR